jgi:hypothetical protein
MTPTFLKTSSADFFVKTPFVAATFSGYILKVKKVQNESKPYPSNLNEIKVI